MTKQVQRRRGTNTQHTGFTGADGEISVNTTNKSIHVHDGATAGGFEAARADLLNVDDADVATAISGGTVPSLTITSADINGGTIDGTTIGANSASAGTFTTLSATTLGSALDLNSQALTNANIDSGAIDGVTLGTNSAVTEAQVDNININGNTIISTDTNGNIALTPNGTGEVDISKVDIDSGAIDGATIGASSAAAGTFTTLTASGDLTVDTNTLHVDSTNNRVGIGTTSPSQLLSLYANDTTDTQLIIEQDSTGDAGIQFSLTGIKNWTVGVDNSDGDKFKIENGNTIGGSNDFVIDSSGNVGIGTSSPDSGTPLHVAESSASLGANPTASAFLVERAGNVGMTLGTANTGLVSIFMGDADSLTVGRVQYDNSGDSLQFWANSLERMRIDSSGNVLVGKTTTSAATRGSYINQNGTFISAQPNGGDAATFFSTFNSSEVGSIDLTTTTTRYNTSSDYRLKENVVADWDATTRLKQLNPVRFNFIADPDTTVDGFLAHEAQDIVPEAVSGTKDAMRDEEYTVSAATGDIYTPAIEAVLDDDGNVVTPAVAEVIHSTDVERPEELAEGQQWRETTAAVMGTRSVPDYQGIDQSKLVPLLVKTIQELEARITALENA